jgi:predicted TIM-barrel fold metal-dependent hydrolase
MRLDDMILISVDDHVIEPPDLFDGRLPARLAGDAPRVVRTEAGDDVWTFNGETIANIGLNAVAGRPKEEFGVEPTAFTEMRPGCFDLDERVKDMNAGGVLASICFPSFPGFAGRLFAACDDKELALAVVRSYNNWMIEEWCGRHPGRMIPMALPVLWDPQLCAEEIRRVAALGCHAMTFTENPHALGFPSFHSDWWDPVWGALSDEGTVLNIHLGSSGELTVTAPDAPLDVMITLQPMNMCLAAADLLWSRVFKQFPGVRIALSEGGIGWIPYFLDRIDRSYETHRHWTHQDVGPALRPSDVFRRHVLTCFVTDPMGLALRDEIGIGNICWEQDYPHSESPWPQAPEDLWHQAEQAGLSDADLDAISHGNAMRWYRFDPFAAIPRRDCTVGALRAAAQGHDVSVRSMDRGRRTRGALPTMQGMQEMVQP